MSSGLAEVQSQLASLLQDATRPCCALKSKPRREVGGATRSSRQPRQPRADLERPPGHQGFQGVYPRQGWLQEELADLELRLRKGLLEDLSPLLRPCVGMKNR